MRKSNFRKAAAGIMSLALLLGTAGYLPAKTHAASASVTINEVCAKNTGYNISGGLYDWIELYNSSSSAVDISGWGLSDKAAKPYRYTFPEGTSIPAGGRLTIACDGTATGTDIAPFGLSTSGETLTLTDKNGTAVDTVTFESLAADVSYGQYPDGSGEYFVLTATPAAPNSAPEGSNAVKLPEFSAKSGFYGSDFDLTISAPQGCTVYYTTDGSDPTSSSEKYTAPIKISDCSGNPNVYSARTDISAAEVNPPSELVDKAAIIRAVAVDAQGRTSAIATNTYFLGKPYDKYRSDIKVVSLVTDPDNLFDYETGIYVKGKVYDDENKNTGGWGFPGFGMLNTWEMAANYTQHGREWERPASFEFFVNGESVLSQDVGIRIKGAASRSYAQKSFNIYSRADYGKTSLDFDFFDGAAVKKKNGKVIDSFDGITLRNGGNDNGYAFFRDSINQSLVRDRNMAVQTTSECVVFLDGEYWGIYQIIEKVNADYLKSHFGVEKNDAIIVKNGEIEEGTDADLREWEDLVNFCAGSDLSNSSNYQKVTEKLDIQSYIDYCAAQIYWNNTDWPQNNFAAWRASAPEEGNPYTDGKWRMFLFDTELSTGLYGNETAADRNSFDRISRNEDNYCRMFTNLMRNKEFRDQFNITLMDLGNYNFAEDKVISASSHYDNLYRDEIINSQKRFGAGSSMWGGSPEQQYESEVNTIKSFYLQRFNNIMQHMKASAGITGQDKFLTVSNDTNSGSIHVNTLSLGGLMSWKGRYFSDQTLTVSAVPYEGFSFDHWEVTGADIPASDLVSPELELNLSSDVTLKAYYKAGSPEALKGDYNGDGEVNISDIVTLSGYLTGRVKTIADTDMNDDGRTTVYDAILLRRAIFKK